MPSMVNVAKALVAVVAVVVLGVSGCGGSETGNTADSSASPIWSGYSTSGGGFRRVTATWTEPAIQPQNGQTAVGFWVGLAGTNTNTVEQIGTQVLSRGLGDEIHRAWFEMYPRPSVEIQPNWFTVVAGDVLTATVSDLGHLRYRLQIINHTTGRAFSTVRKAHSRDGSRGAIIVESQGARGPALAQFSPVHFRSCRFDGRPIDFWNVMKLDIASSRGGWETATSELGEGGASFYVERRSPGGKG